MHVGSVSTLVPWAKRAGFVATCLAAAIAASFGAAQGEGFIGKVCLAAGLALASFIVGYSLVFAYAAFKDRKPIVGIAATSLFAVAVCVELLSHLGFTAASRQADLTQARHQTNTYSDARGELERARADLAAMKQTRTPAAISADMQAIEIRPWFAGTANCSAPGTYTNTCRRYLALKGELGAAQARAGLDKRVQTLAAKAAETTTGHSTAGAQSTALAAMAAGTTKPTAEQEFWTNIGISALLAVFFVMSGLLNFIAFAFDSEAAAPAETKTAQIIDLPQRSPIKAALDIPPSVFGRAAG